MKFSTPSPSVRTTTTVNGKKKGTRGKSTSSHRSARSQAQPSDERRRNISKAAREWKPLADNAETNRNELRQMKDYFTVAVLFSTRSPSLTSAL